MRYQLMVGENIGAGDVRALRGRGALARGAEKGMATPFIDELPAGLRHASSASGSTTAASCRAASGRRSRSRARSCARDADILVLDEPTASMDAEAEATVFEHFRALTRDKIAILISHRFSTVRMADQIVVLEDGRIIERGTHDELMRANGHYAQLFSLQAKGYR